jgi:PAS domain S-box-containing protein
MLRNLQIRHKLLFSYSAVFIMAMTIGCTLLYSIVRKTIEQSIQNELKNTTMTIYNLVDTAATVSIKNYLRAVAEQNHDILNYYYQRVLSGAMTEKVAKKIAGEVLLSQIIGENGYIYCLDSAGTVLVHPKHALLDINVSEFEFVKKQMLEKKGYLEYSWKNPGEAEMRPKALYMLHFEPWDWIISVTSYRKEFRDLVNVDDFKKSVLALRFGKTGYSYVVDGTGKVIIHPSMEGTNILESKDLPNKFLLEMLRNKTGEMQYYWQNPGETQARLKLSLYNYLPAYDWIVASSSYQEEFYEPLFLLRHLILGIFGVTLLMVLPLTFTISSSITKPLQRLMDSFEKASMGKFSLRVKRDSNDEVGRLGLYFNRFMEQLEGYDKNLKQQIEERKIIEAELRESEGRYRSIMEAAPDPIVIYDMEGKVIYFNPAFGRVFGYHLGDHIGRKMDHFVPASNWDETNAMVDIIKRGGSLFGNETKRYTNRGEIRIVSISGAPYADVNQELVGSVIILHDITEKTRLTKRLLDIGDNVRQDIGQHLHDDLCPHLIGTAGLAAVLADKMKETDPKSTDLANKVVTFINEAIAKTRVLARGLCPVHLVAHGLPSALKEIAGRTSMIGQIQCRFSGDDNLIINDNLVATHLYYIAAEAVNNAVKHAKATRIEISIYRRKGYIHLKVTDNGCGIAENHLHDGMGLPIMGYRVKVIGAFFEISNEAQGGTTIHVTLEDKHFQEHLESDNK